MTTSRNEPGFRISQRVREELEFAYQLLMIDAPILSPDGLHRLRKVLGYEVDADGNRRDPGSDSLT